MEQLKPNQILLEISEDKKKVTISCGAFYHPLTFDNCPAKITKNLSNALNTYIEKTGLDKVPNWKSEKCGYLGGKCIDCNWNFLIILTINNYKKKYTVKNCTSFLFDISKLYVYNKYRKWKTTNVVAD